MSDNVYFEPPSRLQLVDKLAHLVRFSNTFLVLAGPAGAGVSTTLEQLHLQIGDDDAYVLALELKGNTNLKALLKLLNGAMDELLTPTEEDDTDQLSALHQKLESLAKFERKLLISIDNANYLSDEGIECLVNLIQANPDAIRIAIGGTQELVTLIARVVADQAPLDFIHNEVLGPFNRLETEEFIQLRFVRGSDFSAKQLSEIYLKSQGYPGLILQLTNEMIKSGKISLNNKSNLLPVPHIIGIAVLLTAITTVSSWQYFSDDSLIEEELVDTLVVDVESGIATQEIELQVEQHSEKAENLKQQISSLSTKIKAQELLIETAREDSDPQRETVELQLDAMALVDDTSSPTIASENLQIKQALKPEQPETQPVLNEVAVIPTAQDAETLAAPIVPSAELSDITNINKGLEEKIAAAEQELSVVIPVVEKIKPIEQEIVAKVKPIEREVKSPSAVQEKAETVDNKQQAVSNMEKVDVTQELRQLTADLQSKIPSHMLETKQIEMQGKVLVQESSFSKKEQANTTKIAAANRLNTKESELAAKQSLNAVVKIVTQPVGLNAKLDAQSISAWPSSGYTLQLLGSRSDKGVLKFLKEMPNSAKMRYFQTKLKNKPWHVVIYGQYPSRSVANSAKAALPAKLKQLKPWVKSIKSVKVDINK